MDAPPKTDYLQLRFTLPAELCEVAMALLAESACEAFEETDAGLCAYVPAPAYDPVLVQELLSPLSLAAGDPVVTPVAARNWNAEWEAQVAAVQVGDFCQVVPTFREPEAGFRHTLRIDPKMSFGTGQHETTRLMLRQLSHLDLHGLRVLDAGTGTGVLGILASKMGAASVFATDIDPWSYENARENLALNDITNMEVQLGDASVLPLGQPFDLILANINRNALLQELPAYQPHLHAGGKVIISGIYEADLPAFEPLARQWQWKVARQLQENLWVALAWQAP